VGDSGPVTRVAIVGGGPGGYEAALVAAQLGAEVTVVDSDGVGGAAVLTDCVPSKTLIATAALMSSVEGSGELGVAAGAEVQVDLAVVNRRVKQLAQAQSADVAQRLDKEGVRVIQGTGALDGSQAVVVQGADGSAAERLEADVVLLATGARPRVLPSAQPDGERILTWQQLYDIAGLPERLIVVGSGVTGLEFAGAYLALGCEVVLVSSRDRVLPGEDADAARVVEDVYQRRGMTVLSRSRMESVQRVGDSVRVTLTDGRSVEGGARRAAPRGGGPRQECEPTAAGSSRSTGCLGRRRARSTPRATARACSCWPPSPPCRAGSPCGTPWATQCSHWT
jgi:pyruvate/2-oxoglutarate dehydrogenase complex dihydrolipoamide dehydrogenase (E3) component